MGILEIITGVTLAIVSLTIYYLVVILAAFLATAVICIVSAILTLVAKSKLLKITEEETKRQKEA